MKIHATKNAVVLAVWARYPSLTGAGFAWLVEHGNIRAWENGYVVLHGREPTEEKRPAFSRN